MDEVCGCPLVKNVFELTGEYCRVSKRKCNKHYNWEKLRRAEVDLERVRVVSHTSRPSLDFWLTGPDSYWCERETVFFIHSGTSWTSCLNKSGTSGPPWPTELVCWLWCCTKQSSTTLWPQIYALTRTDSPAGLQLSSLWVIVHIMKF